MIYVHLRKKTQAQFHQSEVNYKKDCFNKKLNLNHGYNQLIMLRISTLSNTKSLSIRR